MLMLFAGSLRGRGVGAERGVTVTGWVRKQFLQKNIFEIFYFLFFIFYFLKNRCPIPTTQMAFQYIVKVGGGAAAYSGCVVAPLASKTKCNYYAAHDILFPAVHTGAPTGD